MTTQEKQTLNVIAGKKILFITKSKKPFNQIYTVNINKEVKIGGRSERGYKLNFFPSNNESCSCMTLFDILNLVHKGSTKTDLVDMYIL